MELLGASKSAAAKTASGIIAMMDSLQQTDGLIKAASSASTSETHAHELLNLSLTLEDLMELRNKLYKRIQNATNKLFGKDASTAAAVRKAMKNEFLMKHMKAYAIRLKIKHQVRNVLLMSVSFRRRTSREKKGKYLPSISATILLDLTPLPDAKIRQQTDNSIARKTPGIKSLARRYNSMCEDLASHPSRRYYPNISMPPLLDIAELFNPDANTAMWMDESLNEDDEMTVPPAYLSDPKVQEGILGWLGLQRCEEEESRLIGEMEGLLHWISSQIIAIKQALTVCQGMLLPSIA